jgi:anti-sigma B factor antagonist
VSHFMPSPACAWTTHRDGPLARIAVRGELDLAQEPKLRKDCDELDLDGVQAIRVDFTHLDFIDSTGLSWLLHLRTKATAQAADLVVHAAPGSTVDRVLHLTGFDDLVTLVRSDVGT